LPYTGPSALLALGRPNLKLIRPGCPPIRPADAASTLGTFDPPNPPEDPAVSPRAGVLDRRNPLLQTPRYRSPSCGCRRNATRAAGQPVPPRCTRLLQAAEGRCGPSLAKACLNPMDPTDPTDPPTPTNLNPTNRVLG